MNNKQYNILSIGIIILCAISMVTSFVPDAAAGFFGDWYCIGSGNKISSEGAVVIFSNCNYGIGSHGEGMHWGYRHWLWLAAGATLFVIQICRIIMLVERHKTKEA